MRVKSDVEYLRQIPIFSGVDPSHLQVLSFSTKRKSFPTGRFLLKEGAKGTAAFMIIDGTVELLSGEKKERQLVGEAGEGAFLGETAMVAGAPFSFSAKAKTKVVALEISRKLFFEVAEEFPGFAAQVMTAINDKLEGNLQDLNEIQQLLDRVGSWEAI